MNGAREILSAALSSAAQAGDEMEPVALLATLAKHDDPLRAVLDEVDGREIYNAVQREFGFFHRAKQTGELPGAEDKAKLAALIRWVMRELQDWKKAADPSLKKLVALLVVTRFLDDDGTFWRAVPADLAGNTDLLDTLARLLARFDISYAARGPREPPIWETELVEQFQRADAQEDWKTVIALWSRIELPYFQNLLLGQIVRCLFRFGFSILAQALGNVGKTPNAMQMMIALSVAERLKLAAATDNARVQLAATYLSLSSRAGNDTRTDEDRLLLVELLEGVSANAALWAQWMAIFNHHPSRHPLLQPALGSVLAVAPEAAVAAYIDSIELGVLAEQNRQTVAECLRVLRTAAIPERQRLVWRLAYERWSRWRFDAANKETRHFKCTLSAIDYAVVGHALMCMSEEEREQRIAMIRSEIGSLQSRWFGSHAEFTTEWSRLVSTLQPYAHARAITSSGQDWLMLTGIYFPYDPKTDRYAVALSGMLDQTVA